MDTYEAARVLKSIQPRILLNRHCIRAYNSTTKTVLKKDYFLDCSYSYERGYRFNFPGEHPVLYLAADAVTAALEIGPREYQDFLRPALENPGELFIHVPVVVSAHLLDLTDELTQTSLGISSEDLLMPTELWEEMADRGERAPTHVIGGLAFEDGRFDGILYPSYPARAFLDAYKENIAIFMDFTHSAMARPLRSRIKIEVPGRELLEGLDLRF